MNKMKLLYDVVKTMKEKEALNGILTAKLQKDQATLFSLQNEFEKNLVTGKTKVKISTKLDYNGNQVNHESNTEFMMPGYGDRHHGCMMHMHMHHHAFKRNGLKGTLTRLALLFSVLNSLQVEEQENKAAVISLHTGNLPEDIKALIREKMQQAAARHQFHKHHGFINEFSTLEDFNCLLNITLNPNYEVEKMVATLDGTQRDAENEQHAVQGSVEVHFK